MDLKPMLALLALSLPLAACGNKGRLVLPPAPATEVPAVEPPTATDPAQSEAPADIAPPAAVEPATTPPTETPPEPDGEDD